MRGPTGPDEDHTHLLDLEVNEALELDREDREELPGLVRLNTVRIPVLRVIGYQALLAAAVVHEMVFGPGPNWSTFLPLFLLVQSYAFGSWAVLYRFYARTSRLDLGDLFVVLDFPVWAAILLWAGGADTHLWPVLIVHTADQLWISKRRTAFFAGLSALTYLAIPLADHFLLGNPASPAEQAWKVGVLGSICFFLVLVAREPLRIHDRTLAARDWIRVLQEHSRILDEARSRAEAANRAKTEFLARMSHELRTPLNAVIGFTNHVLKDEASVPSRRDRNYLERVRSNSLHLLALINDLLDVARIEEGHLEVNFAPLDLGRLVTDTVGQFEDRARAGGVGLEVTLPDRLEPLVSDEVRLRQVLTNLLGNALKFTEEGQVEVEIEADRSHRATSVHVRDSGIGIPEGDLQRIFLPFEQVEGGTERSYSGSGLGLAISRSICERLGYGLHVRSRPGEGSQFTVDLRPVG